MTSRCAVDAQQPHQPTRMAVPVCLGLCCVAAHSQIPFALPAKGCDLAQGLVGVSGAVWMPRLVRMGKLEAFSSAANKRFHLDAQAAQYATRGDPSLRGAHEFRVATFVLCSHSDAQAGAVRHLQRLLPLGYAWI